MSKVYVLSRMSDGEADHKIVGVTTVPGVAAAFWCSTDNVVTSVEVDGLLDYEGCDSAVLEDLQ